MNVIIAKIAVVIWLLILLGLQGYVITFTVTLVIGTAFILYSIRNKRKIDEKYAIQKKVSYPVKVTKNPKIQKLIEKFRNNSDYFIEEISWNQIVFTEHDSNPTIRYVLSLYHSPIKSEINTLEILRKMEEKRDATCIYLSDDDTEYCRYVNIVLNRHENIKELRQNRLSSIEFNKELFGE